jgi:hypothetical protein
MDFKIIELDDTVCLHRDRDEDGNETVRITAFLEDNGGSDFQAEETIILPSESMVWSFIRDFSDESARDWLDDQYDKAGIKTDET